MTATLHEGMPAARQKSPFPSSVPSPYGLMGTLLLPAAGEPIQKARRLSAGLKVLNPLRFKESLGSGSVPASAGLRRVRVAALTMQSRSHDDIMVAGLTIPGRPHDGRVGGLTMTGISHPDVSKTRFQEDSRLPKG